MQTDKFLEDVNPENYFYVCNGSVLKNMEDLKILLENIDNSAFSCHVNPDKNDFLNWIREVVRDDMLAKNISKYNTKEELLACVKKRINNIRLVTSSKGKKFFKPVKPDKKEEIVELLKNI